MADPVLKFPAEQKGNLDGRPFDGTVTVESSGTVLYSDNHVSREESI